MVLAAGRARELAAKRRNQPRALERMGVFDALKGPRRPASATFDRVLNGGSIVALGRGARRLAALAGGRFHRKRQRAITGRCWKFSHHCAKVE